MSALTKVYLDGEMGARFGREWDLSIKSPSEALSIINANVGGVFNWIRANLAKYDAYSVICEHRNGAIEHLDGKESYLMLHDLVSIRFIPLIEGAKAAVRVVVGVALMVVGFMVPGMQPLMLVGAQIALGGITELLAPKPKKNESGEGKSSRYFNGAQNTAEQGAYVPLIYGKVKTGSQAVSVALSVDEEV